MVGAERDVPAPPPPAGSARARRRRRTPPPGQRAADLERLAAALRIAVPAAAIAQGTAVPADLAADTAVRPDPETPGRYHLDLPDHWDYLLPSGGAAVTCALRAAEAQLGEPQLRLASATAIFCAPVHPGKLVADVTVLRRGGATAQVRVWLRHGAPLPGGAADNAGLEVMATFCRDRRGPDVTVSWFPRCARSPTRCPRSTARPATRSPGSASTTSSSAGSPTAIGPGSRASTPAPRATRAGCATSRRSATPTAASIASRSRP